MSKIKEEPLMDRLRDTAKRDNTPNGAELMNTLDDIFNRILVKLDSRIPIERITIETREDLLDAERIYFANKQ